MLNRLTSPLLLGLALAAGGLMACGDSSADTGNADDTTSSGDGDGDAGDGDGDAGDGDGDGDAGDGDGDGDGDAGDGDGDGDGGDGDGDGDGDGGDGDGDGDCMVWEITYDLTGSEFEISDTPMNAGNQVNVVLEPYDDDDHIGPGNFVLRFNDVDGAPGGNVYMHSYFVDLEFTIGGFVTVHTDLEQSAGPEDCGITSATLDGTTATWDPLAIVGHHSMGEITCTGLACGLAGFMNGVPQPVDETSDQPLEPFEFEDDFSGFTMDTVVVQMDMNSTSEWRYEAIETERNLVSAPACLCE
jgi:hypothetical protein